MQHVQICNKLFWETELYPRFLVLEHANNKNSPLDYRTHWCQNILIFSGLKRTILIHRAGGAPS